MDEEANQFVSSRSALSTTSHDNSITFPTRALVGSLLVMLPWPILGIAACVGLSLLEKPSEAIFMFGSITMIFLLPLGIVEVPEWIYGILMGIVWVLVLFMPLGFRRVSFHPTFHIGLVWVGQTIFSACQAGFGILLLLGKQC